MKQIIKEVCFALEYLQICTMEEICAFILVGMQLIRGKKFGHEKYIVNTSNNKYIQYYSKVTVNHLALC